MNVVALPEDRDFGPQLAIYGRAFYAEAAIDRRRDDALFIFKISAAARRPANAREYKATFELHDAKALLTAPHADAVATLFGLDGARVDHVERDLATAVRERWAAETPLGAISPRCEQLLGKAPTEERRRWVPRPVSTPTGSEQLQARLVDTWRKLRLQACAPNTMTARQAMLLTGGVQAPSSECAELLDVFSYGLLNRVAYRCEAEGSDSQDFHRVVTAICDLPVRPSVRITLWLHALRFLEPEALQRDLHACRQALAIAAKDPELAQLGQELAALLSRSPSTRLQAVADEIQNDESPLKVLLEFVDRLEFKDEKKESIPPHVPAIPAEPISKHEPTQFVLSPIDAWICSQVGIDLDAFEEHRRTLRASLRTIEKVFREDPSPSSVEDGVASAAELKLQLERLIAAIPPMARVKEERAQALAAYDQAVVAVGPGRASELIRVGLTPDALPEAARIWARADLIEATPPWVWDVEPGVSASPPSVRLGNNAVLRRLRLLCQILDAGRGRLDDLRALAPPPKGADADGYIEERLRAMAEEGRWLENVPEAHREWVEDARQRGQSAAHVRELLAAFDELVPRVSTEVHAEIVAEVCAISDAEGRVRRANLFAKAIDALVRELDDEAVVRQLKFPAIRKKLASHDRPEPAKPTAKLRVTHHFLDESQTRARLIFVEDTPQYGYVLAPLLLRAKSRDALELELAWKVSGQEGWPRDWPSSEPSRRSIQSHEWLQRGEEFVHPFTAKIYVRSTTSHQKIAVTISSASFEQPQILDWLAPDGIAACDELSLRLSAANDPSYVTEHPLGPQTKADAILDRMRNGQSLAVMAPRRFGKTTLLKYLATKSGAALDRGRMEVINLPACTSFTAAGRFDADAYWSEVSQRLQEDRGASLALPLNGDLPRPEAFDAVRRLAASDGIQRMVLLVDEAQAMFRTGQAGFELGNRLKDCIPGWSHADASRASVTFVLAGLPSLAQKIGVNLMGQLRPMRAEEIGEDDINRFILKVTKERLQTTKGARERLARLSRSILILQQVVEALVDRVKRARRVWIDETDVKAVEDELCRSLRTGSEMVIASWLRDAFNSAEDANKWEPTDQYPVAVAIAAVRTEGLRRPEDILDKTRERVEGWGRDLPGDTRVMLTADDLLRHVQLLGEAGILKEYEFTSPLLEAWLISQEAKVSSLDFRDALLRAGTPRIRRPDGLERVSEGGQAAVYLFEKDGAQYAYRESELVNDEQRTRFAETRVMLLSLRQRMDRRESGSDCVFDLKNIGLREDDSSIAVQIYRWIEGIDLGQRVGKLDERAVVAIGGRLAAGVEWLHSASVLHRDIRPANVILRSNDMQPVLVDFGLARREGTASATVIGSDCAAPEVRQLDPHWSRAADVYGVAMTLRLLLAKPPNKTLEDILRPFLAQRDADRPTISKLRERLDELRARQRVMEDVRIWFTENVIAFANKEPSFMDRVVEKFRPRFEASFLNVHPDDADRAANAADFLNQVLEAWARPDRPEGLPLTLAAEEWKADDLRLAAALRNDGVHFRRRARLGGRSPRDVVVAAARVMNGKIGTRSLPEITNAFFARS